MSDVAVGTERATAAPPAKKAGMTDRAKAERKLGWLLCAPSVFVMLLVAGFPIVYAFWLSLRRADLRFPDDSEFIGLANYEAVLTSSTWWNGGREHADHHRVLGHARAHHRDAPRAGDVPRDLRPHGDPRVGARALRRRHRRRRVRVAPGLRPGDGLRGRSCLSLDPPPFTTRDGIDDHHHLRRGLEDDAVHRAAAARRPGARPRRPLQGGEGRRRDRPCSASSGSRCR